MQDPSGSGRPLYCNPSTGQTSWERPEVRVLPSGWVKATTPDGKDIFIHLETQRCTFQWPEQGVSPPARSPKPVVQGTPISRTVTVPGNGIVQSKPKIVRSQTVPVLPQQQHAIATRKHIPSSTAANTIDHLSDRNNTRVLSSKFASDLAQTTSAMKEVTISGASLATRQAKVVGQTLVSRKKLGKASKKLVVHTGALTVKTGRAFKGLVSEMVDAADKKGKYDPNQRHPIPSKTKVLPQNPTKTLVNEHQQEHMPKKCDPQPNISPTNTTMPKQQPSHGAITVSRNLTARKPVGSQPRPAINPNQSKVSATSDTKIQLVSQVALGPNSDTVQQEGMAFVGVSNGHLDGARTRSLPFAPATHAPLEVTSAQPTAKQRPHGNPSKVASSVPLQSRPSQQTVSQMGSNAMVSVNVAPSVRTGSASQTQVRPQPKPASRPSNPQAGSVPSVQQVGSFALGSIPNPPSYAQATNEPVARPAARPFPKPTVQPAANPTARPPVRPAANRPHPGRPVNHAVQSRPQHPAALHTSTANTINTINSLTKLVHQYASAAPHNQGTNTTGAPNGTLAQPQQYTTLPLDLTGDQNQLVLSGGGDQGPVSNQVLAGLGSTNGQQAGTQNSVMQTPIVNTEQESPDMASDGDQCQYVDGEYDVDQSQNFDNDLDANEADAVDQTQNNEDAFDLDEGVDSQNFDEPGDENQDVDEAVDADQGLYVDDTVEADQSPDLDQTIDIEESQDPDQSGQAGDYQYADETFNVDQNQYVDEDFVVDQGGYSNEAVEVDQVQDDDEAAYVDESAVFNETGDFEDSGDVDQSQDVDVTYVEDDSVEFATYDDTAGDEVVEETEDEELVYEEQETASGEEYEVDDEVDIEVDATEDVDDVDVDQDDPDVCW